MSPRLAATEQRYQDDKLAGRTVSLLDEPPLQDFKYFKIIDNKYPYDAVARTHLMLTIKRQCQSTDDMTPEELQELNFIKRSEFGKYHSVIENYQAKSVTAIWHVHLVNYLDQRPEWLS